MFRYFASAATLTVAFFLQILNGSLFAEPLTLSSNILEYNPSTRMEYFSSAKALNLKQVRAYQGEWRPLTRPFFHHKRSRRNFWFRLRIRNESNRTHWFFIVASNRLDHVDFHYPVDSHYQVSRDGDWSVWKPDRPAPYPVFPVDIKQGGTATYYLRVRSDTVLLNFAPRFSAPREFGARRVLEQGIQLAYLTLLGLYLIYCGIMLYIRRNYAYLFLMFLACSFFMYSFMLLGDANLIFWSWNAYLRNVMVMVAAISAIFFFLNFSARLLQTRDQFPRLHIAVRVLSVACVLCVPLVFTSLNNHILSNVLITLQLASVAAIFVGTILTLILKRWYVIYFLISFGIMMFTAVCHTFMLSGVLDYNPFTAYGTLLVAPLELLAVAAAISARYRRLVREKEKLFQENVRMRRVSPMEIPVSEGSPTYSDPTLKRVRNLNTAEILEKLRRLADVEQVFFAENVGLQNVAERLGLRADQLSMILNSELKISFNDLVNRYRVEFARRLLSENSNLNVIEIAFMTGFGSRTNFNRVFKKSTGLAPLEYRRKHGSH